MLARDHQDSNHRIVYSHLINKPLLSHYDIDSAMILINAGIDPNTPNKEGKTLLHIVIKYDRLQHIPNLLSLGIDPKIKDNQDHDAYYYLIKEKWFSSAKIDAAITLIKAGVDPNTTNEEGKTLLHMVNKSDHLQHIPDLLNLGIDPKIKDNKNHDACYYLIEKIRFSSAEIDAAITLINAGVDPNTTNACGETLLHLATRMKNGKPPLVRDLLTLGIDPMIKDSDGKTAYDNLVNQPLYKNDDISVVKALISAGVPPTLNKDGKTPLHIAIQYDHLPHIPDLLKLGIDPKIKDNKNHDAYYYLIEKTQFSSAEIDAAITLINAGVDPNTTNACGETLLHLVVAKEGGDKLSLVRDLLALGINPAIKDKFECTALRNLMDQEFFSYNDKKSNFLAAEILMQASLAPLNICNARGQTLLHLAVDWHQTKLIPDLIDQGINFRVKDNQGQTVYDNLVNEKNLDEDDIKAIMALISAGVPPAPNKKGKTPLHIVIECDDLRHIPDLLNLGIDPKIKDDQDRDAYYYLISKRCFSMSAEIEAGIALIKTGIDPNTTNEDGQTLLHLAISALVLDTHSKNRRYNSILMLIELGAKLDIKDKAGKFPFDYFKGERIELFSKLAETMPNLISKLLQQNIIELTVDELTDLVNSITEKLRQEKSHQFDFGLVLDLLLKRARLRPSLYDEYSLIDLAIQRNNLEYIIELNSFGCFPKQESVQLLIKQLETSTSSDFFPYANALLILLEIVPGECNSNQKIKKKYLKEILPMIYGFLELNDLQKYIKKLFPLHPSIHDLTGMATKEKLRNPDRFFTLLSNADFRLELKYATSLYHRTRNRILNLFLDLTKDPDNILLSLSKEFLFYIVELSFDLSVANITRKDLTDLWNFLKKNPEIEIMKKTDPLAKQVRISILQIRRGKDNTFIPYFSAENFCFFYQREKTQLQKTQHRQNPILDTLTVKDLTATSEKKLEAIKGKRLHVFNQHKSILQTKKEEFRLQSSISKTDLYKNAFKKAPST